MPRAAKRVGVDVSLAVPDIIDLIKDRQINDVGAKIRAVCKRARV
jgi:hypothetical protein